jgi:hypothetical protein
MKLGCLNSENRYTSDEALAHPFITRDETISIPMTVKEITMMYLLKKEMKVFFKMIAMHVHITEEMQKMEIKLEKEREEERLS